VVSFIASAPAEGVTAMRDGTAIFSRDLTVGMIASNGPIPAPITSYSFGAKKCSLFGHAHIYGPKGFAFYTAKILTTRWTLPSASRVHLGFPRTR
jgi:malonate-semialdehyde dehydrogenase (acetylating) / methylmalonate-semialdehyde dehydrogenase